MSVSTSAFVSVVFYIALANCLPRELAADSFVIRKNWNKQFLYNAFGKENIFGRFKRQQETFTESEPSSEENSGPIPIACCSEEFDSQKKDEEEIQDKLDLIKYVQKNLFIKGITIDFAYNETIMPSEPNRLISTPGCPKSMKGIIYNSVAPWVYFGNEEKCYLTGVQGPCPNGMKLSIQPGSKNGICKCDCFFPEGSKAVVWEPLNQNTSYCYDGYDHYTYVSEKNQCYPLLYQGPCNEDEWLILDSKTNLPKCETRQCPKDDKITNKRYFYNDVTSSCELRGSQCCKSNEANSTSCDLAYLVDEQYWTPTCLPYSPLPKFHDCSQIAQLNIDDATEDETLYDTRTRQFYPSTCNGPCNLYSNWIQFNETSNLGICSCLYGNFSSPGYNSPIARSLLDNDCHFAYDQGPCSNGYWLVYDKTGSGICRPNPCEKKSVITALIEQKVYDTYFNIENSFRPPFWFFHNGKCYRTYTQGPCKNGEIVIFEGSDMIHSCTISGRFNGGVSSVTGTYGFECIEGYKLQGIDCILDSPDFGFD